MNISTVKKFFAAGAVLVFSVALLPGCGGAASPAESCLPHPPGGPVGGCTPPPPRQARRRGVGKEKEPEELPLAIPGEGRHERCLRKIQSYPIPFYSSFKPRSFPFATTVLRARLSHKLCVDSS